MDRDARLRRRIPTAVMAERASISRTTLNKVEKGDPDVALGNYANVLFVLGMAERLGDLADVKPRVLTTAIDLDDGSASLMLAISVVGYFELDEGQARKIAAEVGWAVATWREEAARLGLTQNEIDRMASAFEHEDLRAALAMP